MHVSYIKVVWILTGKARHNIGRLQRIYAVFNTNRSWLSLDNFFYFSAIAEFPHAFFVFFFYRKSCYSNAWDALFSSWHFTFWPVTCDLWPAKETCRRAIATKRQTEKFKFALFIIFVLEKIFGCVISHKIYQHFCQVPVIGCSLKNNSKHNNNRYMNVFFLILLLLWSS